MNDFREISELYHHGIKGQRWGVRRFQNEDGSLNVRGLKRQQQINMQAAKYESKSKTEAAVGNREASKAYKKIADNLRKQNINQKTFDEIRRSDKIKIGARGVAGLLAGGVLTTSAAKAINKHKPMSSMSPIERDNVLECVVLGTALCGGIGLTVGSVKYNRSHSIKTYNEQLKKNK